jgi:hypothetical protein
LLICSGSLSGVTSMAQAPDLSGVWEQERGQWPVYDAPYTAAGRAAQENWTQDEDPVLLCTIHLGRILSAPLPVEIVQNDQRLLFIYEYDHQVRRIWLDGRDHPVDEAPTLMGHSIGRWDGDTLVVETKNLQGGFMRPEGQPYSGDATIIERHMPIEGGAALNVEITVDDPEIYRQPLVVNRIMRRAPNLEIAEYNCTVRPHLGGQIGQG